MANLASSQQSGSSSNSIGSSITSAARSVGSSISAVGNKSSSISSATGSSNVSSSGGGAGQSKTVVYTSENAPGDVKLAQGVILTRVVTPPSEGEVPGLGGYTAGYRQAFGAPVTSTLPSGATLTTYVLPPKSSSEASGVGGSSRLAGDFGGNFLTTPKSLADIGAAVSSQVPGLKYRPSGYNEGEALPGRFYSYMRVAGINYGLMPRPDEVKSPLLKTSEVAGSFKQTTSGIGLPQDSFDPRPKIYPVNTLEAEKRFRYEQKYTSYLPFQESQTYLGRNQPLESALFTAGSVITAPMDISRQLAIGIGGYTLPKGSEQDRGMFWKPFEQGVGTLAYAGSTFLPFGFNPSTMRTKLQTPGFFETSASGKASAAVFGALTFGGLIAERIPLRYENVIVPTSEGPKTIFRGLYWEEGGKAKYVFGKPESGGLSFKLPEFEKMPSLRNLELQEYSTKFSKNAWVIPKSALETSILTSKSAMSGLGFGIGEQAKVLTQMELTKLLESQKSVFIQDVFPRAIKSAPPEAVSKFIEFAQTRSGEISFLGGSFSTATQLMPEVSRTPGDIEVMLRTSNRQEALNFVSAAVENLRQAGFKVSQEGMMVTGPTGAHFLDVHYMDEKIAEGGSPFGRGYQYGFKVSKKPIELEKLPGMALSEQLVRKGSAATWWQAYKGKKVVEPVLYPSGVTRVKDVADFWAVGKTLAESGRVSGKLSAEGFKRSQELLAKWRGLKFITPGLKEKYAELGKGARVSFEIPLEKQASNVRSNLNVIYSGSLFFDRSTYKVASRLPSRTSGASEASYFYSRLGSSVRNYPSSVGNYPSRSISPISGYVSSSFVSGYRSSISSPYKGSSKLSVFDSYFKSESSRAPYGSQTKYNPVYSSPYRLPSGSRYSVPPGQTKPSTPPLNLRNQIPFEVRRNKKVFRIQNKQVKIHGRFAPYADILSKTVTELKFGRPGRSASEKASLRAWKGSSGLRVPTYEELMAQGRGGRGRKR